jgi:hypothetical protein
VLGRDDSNNLDGEVVAYMNDSTGQDVVLGFKRFFKSENVRSDLFYRRGSLGLGVG